MTLFDVYVNGINPQRLGELDTIKKNVALALSQQQDLERLLYPVSGAVCIQKNISESAARKTSAILTKMGLLCSHQPSKQNYWQNLSLVPLEKMESIVIETVFVCPACQQQQVLNAKAEPKFCPFCHVYVNKYREEEQQKKEYELIHQKMQRLAQASIDYEKQQQREKDERRRKAVLEERIAKEMGLRYSFGWRSIFHIVKLARKYYEVTLATTVFFAVLAGAIYQYKPRQNTNTQDFTFAIPEQSSVPRAITQQEPFTQRDMLDASATELSTQKIQTPAQIESRHNRTRILGFMNTIGLDAGNRTAVTHANLVTSENRLFLDNLYGELSADVEWDSFITTLSKANIASGKLKSAYKLSQYQTDLETHITLITALLNTFSQLKRHDLIDSTLVTLTQRISEQAQEQQAAYKAQLAIALQGINKKNDFLIEAESIVVHLQDPVKQSQAASGMAVHQKNAGQIESANKFLLLAEEKLKNAAPGFEKFSGYINLARNYAKIGFFVNAEIALAGAENLLPTLDASRQEQGLGQLLHIAYLTNNSVLSEKYTEQIKSSAYRAKAVYQYVQMQFKQDNTTDISTSLATIADPEYAAVATALSTFLETDTTKQSYLISAAQLKLTRIEDNEKKAVATSKVARYFYRLGNEKEASILFEQAFSLAQKISTPERKDAVLILLATDHARVFLTERAEQLANMISAKHLRSATFDILKNAKAVKDTGNL